MLTALLEVFEAVVLARIAHGVGWRAYDLYAPDQPPPDCLESRARNEVAQWFVILQARSRLGHAGPVPRALIAEVIRVTDGFRVGTRRPEAPSSN